MPSLRDRKYFLNEPLLLGRDDVPIDCHVAVQCTVWLSSLNLSGVPIDSLRVHAVYHQLFIKHPVWLCALDECDPAMATIG